MQHKTNLFTYFGSNKDHLIKTTRYLGKGHYMHCLIMKPKNPNSGYDNVLSCCHNAPNQLDSLNQSMSFKKVFKNANHNIQYSFLTVF